MSAAWLWVRADLRRRWRSWVVLGLLAGISVGLAAAAVAGARRTDRAVPNYASVAEVPDAAVLANDPTYDDAAQQKVADLPEVEAVYPFFLGFGVDVAAPRGAEVSLLPETPVSMRKLFGPLVAGRGPDPKRADEIVVNEVMRDRFGLDLGATITYAQELPADLSQIPPEIIPPGVRNFRQDLTVVGIQHSPSSDQESTVSSGFYAKYADALVGVTNQFADLRRGERDIERFQQSVQRVTGRSINVQRASTLFGLEKLLNVSDVEQRGLLLFAVAVLIGAGALVGQALVRAVSAGAADLPTWRSIGADRALVVRALVMPATVAAIVGAVTSIVVAIALSPRFPIALTRNYELDLGIHADWLVLAAGALGLVAVVLLTAWVTAEVRVRRHDVDRPHASRTTRVASAVNLPPSLLIGSRLAVEPGRGRRAVPVRSALVGAVVGVLGVVGCLTFRAGLSDAVEDPARSGIVWDMAVAGEGRLDPADRASYDDPRKVAASMQALWARGVRLEGVPSPVWGTETRRGDMDLIVLEGRAPESADEIALAPTTMSKLDARIGDEIAVGPGRGSPTLVVGRAFVPSSSHTEYDESGWMTLAGLQRVLPPDVGPEFTEDFLLLRWREGVDTAAAVRQVSASAGERGYWPAPAALPTSVDSLGQLRSLPLLLAVFFGLLAIATVAHALVTTVRRRRVDLAVLRSIGFTRRDARLAIAWQSTLIALVGLLIGVPLGIITGRVLWRQLAESFPVAYVPPLALLAVLVVVPAAIVVANLVAAGPAHAATRIRPARVLRSE